MKKTLVDIADAEFFFGNYLLKKSHQIMHKDTLLFEIKASIINIVITIIAINFFAYFIFKTFIKAPILIVAIFLMDLVVIWDGRLVVSFYETQFIYKKIRGFFKNKIIQIDADKIKQVTISKLYFTGSRNTIVTIYIKEGVQIGIKKIGFPVELSGDIYPICEWLMKHKIPIETKSGYVQDAIDKIRNGKWHS